MDSIFDPVTRMVKPEGYKYLVPEFTDGTGDWADDYDRVTTIYTKKPIEVMQWRIESRVFDCCGTTAFESLDGYFRNGEEEKQEFLALVCQHMSYYSPNCYFSDYPDALFIVTDRSLRVMNSGEYLKLVLDLGAEKLCEFSNQVHGPSNLCMYSWNPKFCKEELKKYLYFFEKARRRSSGFIPLYLKEQWENEFLPKPIENTTSVSPAQPAKVGTAVPAKEKASPEWVSNGTVGMGDVGYFHGLGLQQLHANQNNQNRRDPHADRNPTNK